MYCGCVLIPTQIYIIDNILLFISYVCSVAYWSTLSTLSRHLSISSCIYIQDEWR